MTRSLEIAGARSAALASRRGDLVGLRAGFIALAGAAALAVISVSAAPSAMAATGAVLRGLDKTTGIARDFTAPIGKSVKFGSLEVLARSCVKRPPEETPETSAYLEIYDTPVVDADKPKAPRAKVFSGWMFWSSPALNALQHPSYDVWVIDCKT